MLASIGEDHAWARTDSRPRIFSGLFQVHRDHAGWTERDYRGADKPHLYGRSYNCSVRLAYQWFVNAARAQCRRQSQWLTVDVSGHRVRRPAGGERAASNLVAFRAKPNLPVHEQTPARSCWPFSRVDRHRIIRSRLTASRAARSALSDSCAMHSATIRSIANRRAREQQRGDRATGRGDSRGERRERQLFASSWLVGRWHYGPPPPRSSATNNQGRR